ncbi:MAG: HAMP domain-containing histidine kinase [Alphaproteobacteria bacterium]|nr:HAMP domain-containing histidine kinase [Alphaproteobacteria bacterium]
MLRRRLYLQIYLTIIASLVLVVVLSAVLWDLVGRGRVDRDYLSAASNFVSLVLPPSEAPADEQSEMITRLGQDLDIDIRLFDSDGQEIAAHGDAAMPPPRKYGEPGWIRTRNGPVLSLVLPDGRWLVVDPHHNDGPGALVSLLLMLGLVAVCVGLAALPLVRRLTKRLEQLQRGVERIGEGDLSARVAVKGRDEIAQLAESFNNAAEKIEKLVGAHRLLLANASHELRTPLSRIRLGLEMSEGSPTPERRAALKQDIAELDALIDEILLMSRLDANERVDGSQCVDLVALAAEECVRYEEASLTGSAPDVPGDPRLLHRLLRNLLENAKKHGAPPVEVEIGCADGMATMIVRDQGAGIADKDRDKVFQPFYRASDRQNVKGYGLGLPLVRQIAEAHGGSVTLVDRAMERSAIRVSLPLARPD